MKKAILSTASLLLVSLWVLAHQAGASEIDPGKLLDSLNSKTAKFKYEWVNTNKTTETTTSHQETESYVFSHKKNIVEIKYTDETRSFKNDLYTDMIQSIAKLSMDSAQIDLEKTDFKHAHVIIYCQANTKCIRYESLVVETNAKGEKTGERAPKFSLSKFQINIVDQGQSLAAQITKDLKDLFSLLTPPPNPAEKAVPVKSTEKTETGAAGKK